MKKLLSLIVMFVLLGITAPLFANADEDGTMMSSSTTNNSKQDEMEMDNKGDEMSKSSVDNTSTNEEDEGSNKENRMNDEKEKMRDRMGRSEMRRTFKVEKRKMHDMRRASIEDIKGNREEAEKNRKDFRRDHKDEYEKVKSELSDDQKNELEKVRDDFKESMKDLREKMKNSDTEEERTAVHAQMKKLAEEHYARIKEIVGNSPEGKKIVDARKDVWAENEMLRKENRDIRSNFRESRKDIVNKYKKAFVKKLGSRLDKVPSDKLVKIADRIDTLIQKFENNGNVSTKRKEAMLSALAALKEIIEEKIEWDSTTNDVVGMIEDLLN